jgi:hypothetical protein
MSYHETLGVPPAASMEEIKKAYRKKVMECHPDRNPGDAEATKRFLLVQEAYEALTNPSYRPPRTTTSTPQSKPRPKNGWIRDAPPPTHDIWGDPIDPNGRPIERPRPKPRPRPVRKAPPPEPEVDLWKSMETKKDKIIKSYWREYDRLKLAMAYEDPDKFWMALDEWVKKNK